MRPPVRQVAHFVDGGPHQGDPATTILIVDPATGAPCAKVAGADDEDVELAVASARRASMEWGRSSLARRTRVLFEFRDLLVDSIDELASLITQEHGKTMADARGEIQRGIEVVEFACAIGEHLKGEYAAHVADGVDVFSYREPIGVVAGITPFNFPAMVPLWMAPIAIACGNAFVLKPSELDPSASVLLAQRFHEAGLPKGVFNVVHGGREAAEALVDHPDVGAISFVGSTTVARSIHRRGTLRGARVQALGGAKNHAVVLPDADLGHVADQLVSAAYGSSGQRCMAVSVAVAVGGVGDDLVSALCERVDRLRVGPGTTPEVDLGPLTNPATCARIGAAIDAAITAGAIARRDGRSLPGGVPDQGYYLGPTILDRVDPAMDAYRDELFGPVLCVVRVSEIDEAIDLISANQYGNGVVVFTNDGGIARRFHRGVSVGMVGINVSLPVPVASFSFGGWKGSLFGDHHIYGPDGVRFYTRGKVVTTRWPGGGEAAPSLGFPVHP